MFNYVHTTGEVVKDNVKILLDPYVNFYLYSLFNAFSESHTFGYDNVDRVSNVFKEFYEILDKSNRKLFADSGGYSIIVGQVKSRDSVKFIQCYNYFLKYYHDFFHNIFSLDIPIFLKEPNLNTCENIFKYNLRSGIDSKKILDENPKLYDKFVFVWQFKLLKQFNIWRQVFDQVYANDKRLKNFAVGGMVSLRGITNIKFSPFIAMAYKILKIISDKNLPYESIMHFLGVYHKYDRFTMIFLDKLFNNYYLKNKQCSINVTFDTVNYALTGLYKVREMPLLDLLPNRDPLQLNQYIQNDNLRNIILEEIENIHNNLPLKDSKLTGLTYVLYSQIIDQQMKKFIEDENLLNLFLKYPNYNQLKNQLTPILNKGSQKYPIAFQNIEQNILANFLWICSFHQIWEEHADMKRIDKGVEKFIQRIGFPFDLQGEFEYD